MKIQELENWYVISEAAAQAGVHPQTLRYYERIGILKPSRSRGNIRLYTSNDIERVKKIQRLTRNLGVNLAGVEIILSLMEQMENLQKEWGIERQKLLKEMETHFRLLDKRG
ncbi:MAG: helix-turn-helix transcriptional regulator [Atribacterota bacterium]